MTPAYSAADLARDLHVSRETLERLERYAAVLVQWQKTVNLVSAATLPDLWRRHMLDSAQLVALTPEDATVWLDLGSGAGFPGLVAAAFWAENPARSVHLVESDRRKCAFLRAAALAMDATVTVHSCRIEAAPPLAPHVISARALAPLTGILQYAVPFAAAAPRLLLPKGRDVERELAEAARHWEFEARLVPSRSDPDGRIVVIDRFARV